MIEEEKDENKDKKHCCDDWDEPVPRYLGSE